MLGRTSMLLPAAILASAAFAIDNSSFTMSPALLVASLLGVVLAGGLIGPYLIRMGLCIAQPDAQAVLAADPRPPVIYLRPFNEDGRERTQNDLADDDDFGIIANQFQHQYLRSARYLIKAYLGLENLTLEQEICAGLRHLGPVIAVGKPGELVPTAGAARAYLTEDSWQHQVEDLLRNAGIVVWHAGISPGAWWELEEIARIVSPEKVVLVVQSPARRANAYADLDRRTSLVLPKGLPRSGNDFNLVTFDATWTPTGHAFQYHHPFRQFFMASGLNIRETLQSFITRHSEGKVPRTSSYSLLQARHLGIWATALLAPIIALIGWKFSSQEIAYIKSTEENRVACESSAEQATRFINSPIDRDISASSWASWLNQIKVSLQSPEMRSCEGFDFSIILDEISSTAKNQASILLPSWQTQLSRGAGSFEDVRTALEAAGAEIELLAWNSEEQKIREDASRNILAFSLEIENVFPANEVPTRGMMPSKSPEEGEHNTIDKILEDSEQTLLESEKSIQRSIEDNLKRSLLPELQHLFQRHLGDQLTLRTESDLDADDNALIKMRLHLSVQLVHAPYGESLSAYTSLPSYASLTTNMVGCRAGTDDIFMAATASVETPSQIELGSFSAKRIEFARRLIDQAAASIPTSIENCYLANVESASHLSNHLSRKRIVDSQ
ncbi:hypothetical protein [Lysobacter antibioticus]|uniref:hypothetical protein n=1 Tax=Lysobacter antibioticus TaxID=84531 RepID=UPI00126A450C|nr:hypothetical protein [Lysobacter antibioticus]